FKKFFASGQQSLNGFIPLIQIDDQSFRQPQNAEQTSELSHCGGFRFSNVLEPVKDAQILFGQGVQIGCVIADVVFGRQRGMAAVNEGGQNQYDPLDAELEFLVVNHIFIPKFEDVRSIDHLMARNALQPFDEMRRVFGVLRLDFSVVEKSETFQQFESV